MKIIQLFMSLSQDFEKRLLTSSCRVISGFCREVDEICGLLGYYAACSGKPLPTFRHNMTVPSSRVKKPRKLIGCPETSVGNCHYTLRNSPEESSSHFMCVFETDRSIYVVFYIQIAFRSYGRTVGKFPGFPTAVGSVQQC